ncbi:MAG: hypothetical protein QNJ60_21785 [Xenococcaceae cyanobacterium MO_188.B19]|nr:hypothetical protein [Xenococcaceae cyanobacterium MO_188.B19]
MDDIEKEIQYYTNPFPDFKIRYVLLWYFGIAIGIFLQLILIDKLTPLTFFVDSQEFEFVDPIYEILLVFIPVFSLIVILVNRQCKLVGINVNRVIGKIPQDFPWLVFVLLIITRFIFSQEISRVSYYPISFLFPKWLEYVYSYNIFTEVTESFIPVLYILLIICYYWLLWEAFMTFICIGILFHKISTKKGITQGIIIISFIYSIFFYTNFISGFILGLLLCLLYIKTRTLIIPFLLRIGSFILYLIWAGYEYFLANPENTNFIKQFRGEFKLGIFLVLLTLPYLSYWIYKHWNKSNQQLPYFVNQ